MDSTWVTIIICTSLIACFQWKPARAATPVIEVIHGHTVFSDAPHWDPDVNILYFVDSLGNSVHRFDPKLNTVTSVDVGERVNIFIPIRGEADKFLIALEEKIAVLCWDGQSPQPTFIKVLGTVGYPEDGFFANEGKADANGVLWAGTCLQTGESFDFAPGAGVLFSFSKWTMPQTHAHELTLPNGISWCGNNSQMYYADSILRVVYAFDFDLYNTRISKPRVIFDFHANGVDGFPGGITTDSDDMLWITCMGAGQIIQIDPSCGALLRTVSIPSAQVTSIAFGGCDLDELYVTSANLNVSPENLEKYPGPGCVFRVTRLGAKGLPANRVCL